MASTNGERVNESALGPADVARQAPDRSRLRVRGQRLRRARRVAYLGCAGALGYGGMKVVWALGGTVGMSNPAKFHAKENALPFLQRLFDYWATQTLAALGVVVLFGLVYPWGSGAVVRPLLRSLGWAGSLLSVAGVAGLIMTASGTSGTSLVGSGNDWGSLDTGIYIFTYVCFLVLGLSFAATTWLTRPEKRDYRDPVQAEAVPSKEVPTMMIEYFHASKFGNGAMVAEEFKRQMVANGVDVEIHHIRDLSPSQLPSADLYLFSSPGRIGKPIRAMRRFLQALSLPAGTRYALLTTEAAPKPTKETGGMPTEEELVAMGQRVRPIMSEVLAGKGLVKVGEEKVYVTKLKGPLEDGWSDKVAAFVACLTGDLGSGNTAAASPDAA